MAGTLRTRFALLYAGAFGLTGLLNFGQVLFYAVGAYGPAFVAYHNLPIWAGDLAGGAVAGAGVPPRSRRAV